MTLAGSKKQIPKTAISLLAMINLRRSNYVLNHSMKKQAITLPTADIVGERGIFCAAKYLALPRILPGHASASVAVPLGAAIRISLYRVSLADFLCRHPNG
jgi:hypothetical protein